MPWTQAGLTESPFVRVFETVKIPHAAALMNFVVLTAALSSMNSNLYLTSRMIFSLSRGGYAPRFIGRAEFARSAAGCVACVEYRAGHRAAGGTAISGNGIRLYVGRIFLRRSLWLVHYFPHAPGVPAEAGAAKGAQLPMRFAPSSAWTSFAGLLRVAGAFISTWWIPGMKITIYAGLPWLVLITLCYFLWARGSKCARWHT